MKQTIALNSSILIAEHIECLDIRKDGVLITMVSGKEHLAVAGDIEEANQVAASILNAMETEGG